MCIWLLLYKARQRASIIEYRLLKPGASNLLNLTLITIDSLGQIISPYDALTGVAHCRTGMAVNGY